jgi:hypothetical protein
MKTNFTLPIEDAFISNLEKHEDGFFYPKNVPGGTNLKAPFDAIVKGTFLTGSKSQLPGFNFTEYDAYKIVLDSKDGLYTFSITGILPNDKTKNVGAEFKEGENIGVVLTPNTLAYRFYENVVINPEAKKKDQTTESRPIDPNTIQQNTSTSVAQEKAAKAFKLPSKGTLFVVGVMALTAFYLYKKK